MMDEIIKDLNSFNKGIDKLEKSYTFILIGNGEKGEMVKNWLVDAYNRKFDYIFCNAREAVELSSAIDVEKTIIFVADELFVSIKADIHYLKRAGYTYVLDALPIVWPHLFDYELILQNKDKFEFVYNLLEDDDSKKVFKSIVEYRITGNIENHVESQYPQYEHAFVKPIEGDVIIDVGSYDGENVLQFAKLANKCCKIYAFEPAAENFDTLLNLVKEKGLSSIVKCVNKALSDQVGEVGFSSDSGSDATIIKNGDIMVKTDTLDHFFDKEVDVIPTIIKVDIEGAEIPFLIGANNVLQKYKPKLQICIYHHLYHLWEIPIYINRVVQGYKFYLGHHSSSYNETVLYAIHIESEITMIKKLININELEIAKIRMLHLEKIDPSNQEIDSLKKIYEMKKKKNIGQRFKSFLKK